MMIESISQKRCPRCGEWKLTSEFHHNRIRADGLAYWCKTCQATFIAEYYKRNRKELNSKSSNYYDNHSEEICTQRAEYRVGHLKEEHAYHLRKNYNINMEDYDRMLAAQSGICAICGNSPNGRKLCVDHSHITGKVRGLLCVKCNAGLGSFDDSPDVLAKAINYLDERKCDGRNYTPRNSIS